jgi:hypothetical protein
MMWTRRLLFAGALLTLPGCSPRVGNVETPVVDAARHHARREVQKVEASLGDNGITLRVTTAMTASSRLDTARIQVDTHDRVVTLSGSVPSPDQKALAARIAQDTVAPGVQVVNHVKVASKRDAPDEAEVKSPERPREAHRAGGTAEEQVGPRHGAAPAHHRGTVE